MQTSSWSSLDCLLQESFPDSAVRTAFPVTNLNTLKSIRSPPVTTESGWFVIHGGQSSFQSGPCFSVSLPFPPSVSSHSDPVFPESQQLGSLLTMAASDKVPMKFSVKALLGFSLLCQREPGIHITGLLNACSFLLRSFGGQNLCPLVSVSVTPYLGYCFIYSLEHHI